MSHKKTADQVLVRELNLSHVLRYIHNEAPVSRAQIAHATGLNKSTVSSLAEALIARRLIHETGTHLGSTGRPAIYLEIDPQAGCIIGVEFGVDFIAVALADFCGLILWRESVETNPSDDQECAFQQSFTLIKRAIEFAKDKGFTLLGIGLSAPGPVDIHKGQLLFAPNLQWKDVPMREIFSRRTGLEVFVENDANAAAIAEHLFGKARRDTDFILLYVGVGLGGGLFLNGKLYRGKNGYAGEIGHLPVFADPLQSPCRCGKRGCWEAYTNQHVLIQKTHKQLAAGHDGTLARMVSDGGKSLSLATIKLAAEEGDHIALEALSDTGAVLGQGIAHLINIFNPEKIILGGPLSVVGEHLIPSIREAMVEHLYPFPSPHIDVEISDFGPDVSLVGAIAIVVENILANPARIERR